MIGEPAVEQRNEQSYVGIRTQVPVHELPTVIPQYIGEVFGWLAQHAVAPAGAPLIRYYTIDMPSKLDVEIGVPIASAAPTNGRVKTESLPVGRYATLMYTGPYDGLMQANAALIDWVGARGLSFDVKESTDGDAFAARFESYLTDP